MDYAALKTEIKEIADVAEAVPEAFRAKCFELLLNRLLAEVAPPPTGGASTRSPAPPPPPSTLPPSAPGSAVGTPIPVKAPLRVFMQRTGVTLDDLQKILLVDGADVHFIREPSHGTVSKGQMEWALLLALKSVITSGDFSADPEDVRSICQEKGYYDKANFAAIFKRQPGSTYFREVLVPQGARQPITTEGQAALGELVKALLRQGE